MEGIAQSIELMADFHIYIYTHSHTYSFKDRCKVVRGSKRGGCGNHGLARYHGDVMRR